MSFLAIGTSSLLLDAFDWSDPMVGGTSGLGKSGFLRRWCRCGPVES